MGTPRTDRAGSRLAIVLTTVIVTTVVLAGGVALATVGLNSVGSPEIVNDSIQSVDIGNGAVKSVDIGNGQVKTVDILNGTVNTADLKDDSVRGLDIKDGTITSGDIAPTYLRWAKVDADSTGATLLDGRGVSGVARAAKGRFTVTFDQSISGCGWLATRNGLHASFGPGAGEITIKAFGSHSLNVWTRDSDGLTADPFEHDGFTLQVLC